MLDVSWKFVVSAMCFERWHKGGVVETLQPSNMTKLSF